MGISGSSAPSLLATTAAGGLLHAWIHEKGIQPSLLLTAPDTMVLRYAIEELTALCACHKQGLEPCGSCAGCRALRQGSNTDIYRSVSSATTISIQEVRTIVKLMAQKPLYRRLIVLEMAEKLTAPAAAALLKTLEEPPHHNRLILTTTHPRRLLKTIRSRCQHVRLVVPLAVASKLATSKLRESEPLVEASVDENTITEIGQRLGSMLRQSGPDRAVHRALLRVRDYALVRSQRGNTRLAYDVLVATLPREVRDVTVHTKQSDAH